MVRPKEHPTENRLGMYLVVDLDYQRGMNWAKLMVRPKEHPTANRLGMCSVADFRRGMNWVKLMVRPKEHPTVNHLGMCSVADFRRGMNSVPLSVFYCLFFCLIFGFLLTFLSASSGKRWVHLSAGYINHRQQHICCQYPMQIHHHLHSNTLIDGCQSYLHLSRTTRNAE